MKVSASGVKWKETKESSSFLDWFDPKDEDLEIAEIIKDEVWKHPVEFYLNVVRH